MTKLVWLGAQAEFEACWTGKDQWCYAFEDTRAAQGNSGKKVRVFTKARPSDYLVVNRGLTFFAEVKSSHDEVSFNLNNVETMQWTAAIRSVAAGGLYFFFVWSVHWHCWFKVPASVFVEQRKTKKSIKWTELQPYKWDPKNEH